MKFSLKRLLEKICFWKEKSVSLTIVEPKLEVDENTVRKPENVPSKTSPRVVPAVNHRTSPDQAIRLIRKEIKISVIRAKNQARDNTPKRLRGMPNRRNPHELRTFPYRGQEPEND